jgi:hypothetical protein
MPSPNAHLTQKSKKQAKKQPPKITDPYKLNSANNRPDFLRGAPLPNYLTRQVVNPFSNAECTLVPQIPNVTPTAQRGVMISEEENFFNMELSHETTPSSNQIDKILPAIVIETPYSPSSRVFGVEEQSGRLKFEAESLQRDLKKNSEEEESRTLEALSSLKHSPMVSRGIRGPTGGGSSMNLVVGGASEEDHQLNIRANNSPIYCEPPSSSQMGFEYKPLNSVVRD